MRGKAFVPAATSAFKAHPLLIAGVVAAAGVGLYVSRSASAEAPSEADAVSPLASSFAPVSLGMPSSAGGGLGSVVGVSGGMDGGVGMGAVFATPAAQSFAARSAPESEASSLSVTDVAKLIDASNGGLLAYINKLMTGGTGGIASGAVTSAGGTQTVLTSPGQALMTSSVPTSATNGFATTPGVTTIGAGGTTTVASYVTGDVTTRELFGFETTKEQHAYDVAMANLAFANRSLDAQTMLAQAGIASANYQATTALAQTLALSGNVLNIGNIKGNAPGADLSFATLNVQPSSDKKNTTYNNLSNLMNVLGIDSNTPLGTPGIDNVFGRIADNVSQSGTRAAPVAAPASQPVAAVQSAPVNSPPPVQPVAVGYGGDGGQPAVVNVAPAPQPARNAGYGSGSYLIGLKRAAYADD